MYLPRQGLRNNTNLFANSGSIRDNHDFEEEMGGKPAPKRPSPGPGEYVTERSSF